jgi:glycosyltransferase involved in cell wall biosynthesis
VTLSGGAGSDGDVPLTDGSIVLATHYHAPGAGFELEAFLVRRSRRLLFIGHPLFAESRPSLRRLYSRGQLSHEFSSKRRPGLSAYVVDLWLSVRWTITDMGRCDGFIAGDHLLALAGLWLRWRRRVRWVVLYTQDYVPQRFANRLLNRVYHAIDRFAAQRVNVVWNVSREIETARRERDGPIPTAPQMVVPIGAQYERIERIPLSRCDSMRLVYAGSLFEKQGLQLVIEALPAIRERVPEASLLVIGDGPFAPLLHDYADQLGVRGAIEFSGFSSDHQAIERKVAQCGLALATYVPHPTNFSRFADPSKIKLYLACGLPIVMTDVVTIAAGVVAAGAGRVIDYSAHELTEAVLSYLTNPDLLEAARGAAAKMASGFSWDRIFATAFVSTATHLQQRPCA